ncbi:MAG: putative DNA binding domain-containing protein [Flavobacteriales bacterium]|nr:putative DNA binding domain-containing protein [Flavobacteriales bacterium]
MSKHIYKLLNQGEDETLDYKQAITSASKIAKTMSAFANHKGGTLLVGVKDNRKVCGIQSEDEIYMLDMAARFYCKPEIDLEIIRHQLGDKEVLECRIKEGTDKPYYAKDDEGKWWAYIRVKDNSLLASKIVLDVLKRGNSEKGAFIEFGHNEKAILEYLETNHKVTLEQFRKLVNISKRRASKILVNLISAGVVRSHTTEKTEFYTRSNQF